MVERDRYEQTPLDVTRRVPFGRTGLMVTPLCIGAAPLGSMPDAFGFYFSEEQASQTLRHVFSSPFNFLDTASLYKDSERRIGNVLREIGGLPQGFVLATKADRDPRIGDFSGEVVRRSLTRSQELLGIEKFPLVWLHDPEHSTYNTVEKVMAKGGPAQELLRMKEEGIIEHIGISGGPINLLMECIETDFFEAVLTHNRYNLLHRQAEPLLTRAGEKGIVVVNAAPFASGIFARGSETNARLTYRTPNAYELARIQAIEAACRRYNISTRAAALQFSLRDPRVTATIAGMTSPKQIDQALEDSQVMIPPDLWKKIDYHAIYTGDPERP